MDYLTISPTPTGEDCAQLGSPDYAERSSAECRAFVNQLKRELGKPPFGASLRIKSFDHDFGSYKEVVVVYDENDEEAAEYAYKCESDCPEYWDDLALAELAERGYPTTSAREN